MLATYEECLAERTVGEILTFEDMTMTCSCTDLSLLSTPELAEHCAEEIDHFRRESQPDGHYVFELMRRALAEQSAEAFTYLYQLFEPLVTTWVYRHSRFSLTGESAEYFVPTAFQSFYFAVRGPKFERFPTLHAVLSYLKCCVHTAIAEYLRNQEPSQTIPLDDVQNLATEPDPDPAGAHELWTRICALLPDERSRRLARCVFVLDLKPREIRRAYHQDWESERKISVALYQIRRILRSDQEIAALLI